MPRPSAAQFDMDPSQPLDLEAEAQKIGNLKRSGSRASLPLSVQPSTPHSDPGKDDGIEGPSQQRPAAEEEDYQWGPSHPCFPHTNPHVPLDSPLYHATKIIRVKRDWMVAGDLAPTFANLYPEVLDPLVSEESFRPIIRKVNSELVAAFSPWKMRAWVDALLGAATFWLWDDMGFTGVKSRLKHLEQWIEEWNRGEGEKEGVRIIPLRRTGYMTVSRNFRSSSRSLFRRLNWCTVMFLSLFNY